jgi:cytoskeleton protein RodZ
VGAFGVRMKQERERRGVTLDEISLGTKISTRFLRAIEDEHFEQLPGGIFNKGFIRAYARHLGMDEEQIVADYLAATGATATKKPEANDAVAQPLPEKSRGAANLPWGLFVVGLLILALGFSVFGFYSREKLAKSRNLTLVKAAPTAPGKQTAAPPAGVSHAPVPAQTENVTVTSQEPAQRFGANATPPGAFAVSLKTTDECWVAITADGKEVFQDTLLEGAQKTITAGKEIVIKAGNVGALDFEFNGEALPAQGEDGEVKTLVFDAHGLRTAVPQLEPIVKPQP